VYRSLAAFDLSVGESVLFNYIQNHLSKFGVIPSQTTIEGSKGLESSLVEAPEPPAYYLAEVERRFLQAELKKMMITAKEHLDGQKPDEAFQVLLDRLSSLNIHNKRKSLIDFRDVADTIQQEYIQQSKQNQGLVTHTLELPWPTMQGMAGGLRGGDVFSIVGRPATGKTFMELCMAHHTWRKGNIPLVVSMEMNKLSIAQRLAAMNTKKPLTNLIKGMMTKVGYTSMMELLTENKEINVPFWLVDGNLASTVEEVIMLSRQLKVTSVFIDGAPLLKHPNYKMSKWERISENAEMIKQRLATDLNLPVVASYHFSKESTKKKKSKDEKVGLGDIYGSDSIAQLSSLVVGLFEDEGIETQFRRKVDILKGRNGETGEFLIKWDFKGMDFAEISTKKDANGKLVESTDELQFIN